MKAIINGKIIFQNKILLDYILLFDEKIVALSIADLPIGCEVIDAKGYYVSAGFIDMHIHGSGGADVMDATTEALEIISQSLLQTGTTSFVATTMTMQQENIVNALDTLKAYGGLAQGAKIRGVHLEGPFLNPQKSGAQDTRYIQEPNMEWMMPYLDMVRVITLAPEMEGAEAFIKQLSLSYPHIILSIGHSEANYEQAIESFHWGISHATHLFNAMPGWHHRAPGIIGAVFDTEMTADVIADLVHTHPSVLNTLQKVKKDQIILISDAMRAGCMKSGHYDLGGQEVTVSQGKATLRSGVLAGSVLRLNEAVKNYYTYTEASLIEAVAAVTLLPAQRLGIPAGELREGYDADIVIFDEEIVIQTVLINGDVKYHKDEV